MSRTAEDKKSNLQKQINNLLLQVTRLPKVMQKQFYHIFVQLSKELNSDQKLKNYLQKNKTQDDSKIIMMKGFKDFLKNYLKLLDYKLINSMVDRAADRALQEGYINSTKKIELLKKKQTFQKVQILYPQYDVFVKISKLQNPAHLNQYHTKNKYNRYFYTQPRYINRIDQFQHFKNHDAHKGDIILVNYQGQTIAGSKMFLVANDKTLQVWAMNSQNYPTPNLIIPVQDDYKKPFDLKNDKKQQKIPEPPPPQSIQKSKQTPKFKFLHKIIGHAAKITSISMTTDCYYAITGSVDKTIRLWDLRLYICIAIYRGHIKTVWDVQFSPFGYYFLSGGGDGFMLLWKTDQPLAQRAFYHKGQVSKVSFGRDPAFVISGGEDGTIKIWKTLQAELVHQLKLNNPINTFTQSFSGVFLISVQSDGKISIFNIMQGLLINSFYFHDPTSKKNQDDKSQPAKILIHDVAISEDQRELSCVCAHYVVVYNMQKLQKQITHNIFSFFNNNSTSDQALMIQPKELIYMGIDENLTHCKYLNKSLLLVAGTKKQS